jgi:hypothetical protein
MAQYSAVEQSMDWLEGKSVECDQKNCELEMKMKCQKEEEEQEEAAKNQS